MQLFNEYGMLSHKPSLELSSQIHRLVAAHVQQLVDVGCSPVEIRALGSYFCGEGAIAETVLRFSLKKSKAERNARLMIKSEQFPDISGITKHN